MAEEEVAGPPRLLLMARLGPCFPHCLPSRTIQKAGPPEGEEEEAVEPELVLLLCSPHLIVQWRETSDEEQQPPTRPRGLASRGGR